MVLESGSEMTSRVGLGNPELDALQGSSYCLVASSECETPSPAVIEVQLAE